ncbi:MAG: divergent PAP2 family protein [Candidatus Omnitrophica bacterium]|nr:divergent PAP2 family protein [Candidatus Omnitrophota bacterium]
MNIIQWGQNNLAFITVLSSVIIAQTLKVVFGIIRERKFDFRWFLYNGGMPSSHTAAVCSMALVMAFEYGFSSPLFVLAFMVAIVVITDAQGVRRASGKQAEILNKILDDIYWKKKIQEDRLKELLGHTPVEVVAGIVLGIVTALIFYRHRI